jgi:hypothetical protein
MKLKKGSKAARDFMAKLRASRGIKKKLSGNKKKAVKKSTAKAKKVHTDVKSHNYKISISGAGDYAKFEISTIKALAKLLKKPLKTTQKAVYDNKNLLDLISFNFDQGTTPSRTAKILKDHLIPKKQIKPLDAFVNLLTKKGKGQNSTGSKANFPMKLPATVTIGALNKDNLQNLKERLDFNDTLIKFIADLEDQQKKGKYTLTFEQKNAISKHKRIAKKQLINNLKQIQLIKKSI